MNHMHLQVAFMFHPYHPHHLQKLMKMEDLENLMKLPTMVLFEKVMSEGVLVPANWKSTSNSLHHVGDFSDGVGNESKVKKVELKVGGITRTITARSASDGASAVGSYNYELISWFYNYDVVWMNN
ncbi:HIT ZINC FINGER AND PAPA-1-LIKE DOMAIN-CONTAINING PROTEIN [Salix viminalis]|uniref:HIT ZINC FINGER AND PAPA-1-LIKE DOMAIN-CONTAINING PROTEIN n=1 Tax=Salix viminalis TaxID=40686 RepID=A0A9Q0UXE7_SALVM|nr:HIT ZINC FINGER AND PAPA-1-LIKE DOMAIN-CONTAINING PROTEIN [Salix viminalis]